MSSRVTYEVAETNSLALRSPKKRAPFSHFLSTYGLQLCVTFIVFLKPSMSSGQTFEVVTYEIVNLIPPSLTVKTTLIIEVSLPELIKSWVRDVMFQQYCDTPPPQKKSFDPYS